MYTDCSGSETPRRGGVFAYMILGASGSNTVLELRTLKSSALRRKAVLSRLRLPR